MTVLKNIESAPGKSFLKSTTPQPPPPPPPPPTSPSKAGGRPPPPPPTWKAAPWALLYTTDLNLYIYTLIHLGVHWTHLQLFLFLHFGVKVYIYFREGKSLFISWKRNRLIVIIRSPFYKKRWGFTSLGSGPCKVGGCVRDERMRGR